MTTDEAIRVAMIMAGYKENTAKQIAMLLMAFPEVDLVEFFNVCDGFIDTQTHDRIMFNLEILQHADRVLKGR